LISSKSTILFIHKGHKSRSLDKNDLISAIVLINLT
jgi:hypothetical protein